MNKVSLMTTLLISILAFAMTAGQLIRIPLGGQGAVTILDITAFLFCLGALFNLRSKLKKPPQHILAAFIFIAIAISSLIFTPLQLTRSEYLTSFFYILRFSLYIIFGWLLFLNAFNLQKKISKILLISGISFAGLGILQFIFFPNLNFLQIAGWDPHYFRTVSTFLDPNFAGSFLVLTLLLLPSLREVATTKQSSLIFIFIFAALLTTFSRSSYLMFLFSGLTFAFLKKSKTLAAITLILFVILLTGFQTYTYL
ncbi:MAG: hypothetical protein NUV73_04065, partial [Candidatus Daviesbacteria bacterium]|nr:hypothetical protein [Candidatus Daviesbacteria bacterium]